MINLKNFDNIRIVALISVLLVHTCLNNAGLIKFANDLSALSLSDNYYQLLITCSYINLFKSGTIIFFIISGFLFEKQSSYFTDFSLFVKKKAKSLLKPYLILFVVPTIIIVGIIEPNVGVKENYDPFQLFVKMIENIFLTNYWFVPGLFVTLIINFFIKSKNVFKSLIWFSLIWVLSYVNLYCHFVMTNHTIWLIAFFFVFALGRLMYMYNDKIANFRFLTKNNLILATIVFYIISNIESMVVLEYGHNLDYVNTLRIGNILYSFSLFFLLNDIFNKVKFVMPIDVSFYFIYLVHPFVLRLISVWLFKNNLLEFEYPMQLVYNIINFLILAIICFVSQQIFFKLSFKSNHLSQYVFKK